jgi:hypothetical protein
MSQTRRPAGSTTAAPKGGDASAKRVSSSSQAQRAAREFKDVHVPRAPAKLKGGKSAEIRRAVLSYYRG